MVYAHITHIIKLYNYDDKLYVPYVAYALRPKKKWLETNHGRGFRV